MKDNYKFNPAFEDSMTYSDVFIVPKYSSITSRKEVDVSSKLGKHNIQVPVISANMESVTDARFCNHMRMNGALGALHRFDSIEQSVKDFKECLSISCTNSPIIVSLGVNRDSQERAKKLYEAGARYFIIDIAHGHSSNMKDMISFMKNNFDDCFVIAGNVATSDAAYALCVWGADAVKCGIANGAVCLTKNVTGVVVPMVNSLISCRDGIDRFINLSPNRDKHIPLIADGGIAEIGDICKAIALGADFVMCGRLFAGCDESPNGLVYRGSASKQVQEKYRTESSVDQMPTPEGKEEVLKESAGPVANIIKHISGGLKSSFSYVGARNMEQFHRDSRLGTRRQSQQK